MNLVEYWKKRCELAEAYIEESPCDPDIYKEQLDAWNNWCEFKKLSIPDTVEQGEQLVCDCGNPNLTWYGNDDDKTHFCFECKKEVN